MYKLLTSLDELRKEMESGVFDFTDNGKCTNCGACCSNFLPMSDQEAETIMRYIEKNDIKEVKRLYPFAKTPALDCSCPFRSDSKKKCLIYEVRPAICRDFKCDKPKEKIEADKDMYHGKYSVVDMRETFFGE